MCARARAYVCVRVCVYVIRGFAVAATATGARREKRETRRFVPSRRRDIPGDYSRDRAVVVHASADGDTRQCSFGNVRRRGPRVPPPCVSSSLSFVRPYHSFSLTRDTSHSRVHRYSHDDAIDVYGRASVQYVYAVYNTWGINVFAAAVVAVAVAVARLSRTYYVRVCALYLFSLVPSRYHSVFLAPSKRHVRAVRAAGIHETARSKLGADSRSSEGM